MLTNITFYQVLGLPLIAWGGMVTLLLLLATAASASLNMEGIYKIPVKWHMRLAYLTISLSIVHAILGILAFI